MALDVGGARQYTLNNAAESFSHTDLRSTQASPLGTDRHTLTITNSGIAEASFQRIAQAQQSAPFDARPGIGTSLEQPAKVEERGDALPQSVVNLRRSIYERSARTDISASIDAAERGEQIGNLLTASKCFQGHGQIGRAEQDCMFTAMSSIANQANMDHMEGYINHNLGGKFNIKLNRTFSPTGSENVATVVDPRTKLNLGTYRRAV